MKSLTTAILAASFLNLALAQVSGQATCYFANGTAIPKTPVYLQYQACSGSSICCGLNRSNPSNGDPADGFTMDECLPNGLCQNRVTENGIGKVSYWADFCTDSDVSGGNCLDVCHETKNAFGNTALVPCDGTATSDRWCCGGTNGCCTSNVGVVRLAQVLGGTIVSSSTASTATRSATTLSSAASSNSAITTSSTLPASVDSSTTSTSTGAASGSNSSGSSSESGSKLSGGAIAGIVIGALAGVALLAAAIFFARRAAMWKKKASAASVAPPYTQYTNRYTSAAAYEAPIGDKHANTHQGEMYGSAPAHELPVGSMGSELPAQAAPKK